MFAAPIFFKNLADPTLSYGMMAIKFLPAGLLGLVLASMFANTLSMTASDSNTVSAVITRDILPVIFHQIRKFTPKKMLILARTTTFSFTILTIIIAINSHHFGGVFGLIVSWFASLLGPIAIPMILGLLPIFKRCGSKAALVSIFGGLLAFVITKIIPDLSLATEVATPMLTSLFLYITTGYLIKEDESPKVNTLFASLNEKKN